MISISGQCSTDGTHCNGLYFYFSSAHVGGRENGRMGEVCRRMLVTFLVIISALEDHTHIARHKMPVPEPNSAHLLLAPRTPRREPGRCRMLCFLSRNISSSSNSLLFRFLRPRALRVSSFILYHCVLSSFYLRTSSHPPCSVGPQHRVCFHLSIIQPRARDHDPSEGFFLQ